MLISIVATPIYIPKTVTKGSLFSKSSSTLVISCLFDESHSDRWEVISHGNSDSYFPGEQ